MLDSILGLPVHPLLVHLPVVLLPLAAAGLVALVAKPSWRPRFAVPLLGLLALGAVGALGAKLSGSPFSERVGFPAQHASFGDATAIVAGVLLAVGGWWLLAARRDERPGGLHGPVGWVVALLAVAVTVLTVLTGHTGASSAWGDQMQPQPASSPTTADTQAGYTMADVQAHATPSDCWAAVDGNVYDLTEWIPQHPGGAHRIEPLCGTDASADFGGQHATNETAQATLQRFFLGPLG